MRSLAAISVVVALALAGCETGDPGPPPLVAGAPGPPPVLDSVTIHDGTVRNGFPLPIPEFHFHAVNGDVAYIARDLVDTNGPYLHTHGAVIDLPPDLQRRGAIFAGGWPCGPNVYYARLRAYLVDRSGQHSNAIVYTIHCNGG